MQTTIAEDGDPATQPLFDAAVLHIIRSYKQAFCADNRTRPSRLVITAARAGDVACATSISCHSEGFFSQQYLDAPVSRLLTGRTGLNVPPEGILEVGGLACTSPFAAYPTLRAVFQWGRERGIGWGIFTATSVVRLRLPRGPTRTVTLFPYTTLFLA